MKERGPTGREGGAIADTRGVGRPEGRSTPLCFSGCRTGAGAGFWGPAGQAPPPMRNVGARAPGSCGAQGGFDFKADGAVARRGDGEAFKVQVAERVAGGQCVHLVAGLQDEGAHGLAADMWFEGSKGVFEIAAEQGVQSLQGRQRLVHKADGGAVRDGDTWSKAGVAAQGVDGGATLHPFVKLRTQEVVVQGVGFSARFGDEGARWPVTGRVSGAAMRPSPGVRRQGLRGVLEQVAGGRGEDREAAGIARVRGGAQGIGQQSARDGVDAARPAEGGERLYRVRPAGDFDDALKLPAVNLKADAETAPAGGPGEGRR